MGPEQGLEESLDGGCVHLQGQGLRRHCHLRQGVLGTYQEKGAIQQNGRVCEAVVQIPDLGPVTFVSLYLKDSVGFNELNLEVLGALGERLRGVDRHFVAGADWNNLA